jgi:Fur family ferric uptake transcriptional regulator
MLILSSVRHAAGHITASQILDEVRLSYPYIDASTVYRTLASAKELRIVSETNMGSGDNYFEWIGMERHHHLICRVCGVVSALEERYLDAMAVQVAKDTGFQPDLDHIAFFGVCGRCREKLDD